MTAAEITAKVLGAARHLIDDLAQSERPGAQSRRRDLIYWTARLSAASDFGASLESIDEWAHSVSRTCWTISKARQPLPTRRPRKPKADIPAEIVSALRGFRGRPRTELTARLGLSGGGGPEFSAAEARMIDAGQILRRPMTSEEVSIWRKSHPRGRLPDMLELIEIDASEGAN